MPLIFRVVRKAPRKINGAQSEGLAWGGPDKYDSANTTTQPTRMLLRGREASWPSRETKKDISRHWLMNPSRPEVKYGSHDPIVDFHLIWEIYSGITVADR